MMQQEGGIPLRIPAAHILNCERAVSRRISLPDQALRSLLVIFNHGITFRSTHDRSSRITYKTVAAKKALTCSSYRSYFTLGHQQCYDTRPR
jgi:hypothetical protein